MSVTKISESGFLDRIRDSYKNSALINLQELSDALAHVNFLDSPPEIQESANRATISSADLAELPRRAARFSAAVYLLGGESPTVPPRLFWLIPKAKLLTGFPSHIRGEDVIEESTFRRLLDRLTRTMLWVSDWTSDDNAIVHAFGSAHAAELLADLALVGQAFEVGEEIFALEVIAQRIHKPTLLDAGFSFFWFAARTRSECGLVRSLRTGVPLLREWVITKLGVRGVACQPITVSARIGFTWDNLSSDYWNMCRKEILEHRV